MVTTKINGFIVKRVMVDQGSGDQCGVSGPVQRARIEGQRPFEIHTPLVGFDGHMVILEGQISLPLNMEGKEVVVTFIVVTSFSPNTAILGRLWMKENLVLYPIQNTQRKRHLWIYFIHD